MQGTCIALVFVAAAFFMSPDAAGMCWHGTTRDLHTHDMYAVYVVSMCWAISTHPLTIHEQKLVNRVRIQFPTRSPQNHGVKQVLVATTVGFSSFVFTGLQDVTFSGDVLHVSALKIYQRPQNCRRQGRAERLSPSSPSITARSCLANEGALAKTDLTPLRRDPCALISYYTEARCR